ncbi:cell wall protein [Streptomyces megasporus]|uniref:cell wall protein n=1 Tax=Streptomyces megasporus TaxID=44060 RepID=UPI0012FF35E5|nr:cell wall protein [Streptomyces megasporus]
MPGRVHGPVSACPDSPLPAWTPVPREQQEATTTTSRRAQPRAWLRAVRWLVSTGLHPKANATTLRVAEDLARRMDYLEGRVLYDLLGTAARIEVSVPTVKRHAAALREAGLLVWLEHGTRRNLHLPGRPYAGTATVYGAAIPPVFDDAMGHRIDGRGYDARIVDVTDEGRERAVAEVRRKADSRRSRHDPPSPGGHRKRQKVEVGGGLKDTPRRAACPNSSIPKNTTGSRSSGRRRHGRRTGRPAHQVARDIAIARRVRPLVGWTQHETLRRLAFALRSLIDTGLDAEGIAAELHSWFLDWRPARPAAYIVAELRRRADRDTDPALVRAAIEHLGMRHACRLYTTWLVDQALARSYRVSDRTVIHG